ncbi:hypothetical protein ACQP2F_30805 [Actinoplanes sp. CA-030573]|uniref:hypothetical protein n=1 Tax=Actinoplanes sp. CA-030573 TaxID=3239898 RepID=UPI003D8E5981
MGAQIVARWPDAMVPASELVAREPEFGARVTVTHPEPVPERIAALAAAIPHRHTNRLPFADLPVAPPVIDELRAAARTEGAVLAVASPAAADAILSLARTADDYLHTRPGYRRELARRARPSRSSPTPRC